MAAKEVLTIQLGEFSNVIGVLFFCDLLLTFLSTYFFRCALVEYAGKNIFIILICHTVLIEVVSEPSNYRETLLKSCYFSNIKNLSIIPLECSCSIS